MNLSGTIKAIQDIMRKDDGVDGDAQRIGQLTWMLFLKIFDQREEEWEDDAAVSGKSYVSPLPERLRWRNWAAFVKDTAGKAKPQMGGSDLLLFVDTELFPALREIPADEPIKKVIRQVFEDSYNYMKSGTLMLGVIEKLEEAVDFHDFKTRQNLGDIYEQILNDLRSAGNSGEFYTPRAITHFMVQRVNPSLARREVVLDPACGTGGFLTATIDHFRAQLDKKSKAADKKAIAECIRGYEKKQLPHLLCTTNMLLHGIDVPSMIDHRNTLAKGWNEWNRTEQVSCVITNPPFGGMEDDGVGADFPTDIRTRETADMFLTLIVKRLLKDGGRGAVVLPDGTLFGEGVKAKVKELLLSECDVHTIVRLPNGVFAPYTGIKTNLLFFTKGKPTETIWYYEHPYPEGYKSYSKTKPIRLEEFAAEATWWGSEADGFADRKENERAWKVDFKTKKETAEAKAKPHWEKAEALNRKAADAEAKAKTLKGSAKDEALAAASRLRTEAQDEQSAGDRHYWPIFNLDSKNPATPDAVEQDPDELLDRYRSIAAEIENIQDELKAELSAALAHHFTEGESR